MAGRGGFSNPRRVWWLVGMFTVLMRVSHVDGTR
jgi:hypothetical protein